MNTKKSIRTIKRTTKKVVHKSKSKAKRKLKLHNKRPYSEKKRSIIDDVLGRK